MIAIIDYGMGNLRSVAKALEKVGASVKITQSASDLESADRIVLPGVGAIKPAMEKLEELDIVPAIKKAIESGKPFLGICVGYQLLFERSDEGENARGMGILKGDVKRFASQKIPQIGWNKLNVKDNAALFEGLNGSSYVYFCHSYFVAPQDAAIVTTTTNYGCEYASSICRGNLFGVQFHPEKSQEIGLKILKNFTEIKA